ncbi:hypothetical protein GH722_13370 [Alphaproteobacteria bacterium HT1-32]|nr:hypothetical protein [Alphaproteobacteria bacterium HT1-32]
MLTRRLLVAAFISLTGLTTVAYAHHGWRWTADGNVEVIGIIKSATLGNPHGVLILDVEGEEWTAEVGQPWRNARAGLSDDLMAPGTEITIIGQRSADPKEKRVKAERIRISNKLYELYPERD